MSWLLTLALCVLVVESTSVESTNCQMCNNPLKMCKEPLVDDREGFMCACGEFICKKCGIRHETLGWFCQRFQCLKDNKHFTRDARGKLIPIMEEWTDPLGNADQPPQKKKIGVLSLDHDGCAGQLSPQTAHVFNQALRHSKDYKTSELYESDQAKLQSMRDEHKHRVKRVVPEYRVLEKNKFTKNDHMDFNESLKIFQTRFHKLIREFANEGFDEQLLMCGSNRQFHDKDEEIAEQNSFVQYKKSGWLDDSDKKQLYYGNFEYMMLHDYRLATDNLEWLRDFLNDEGRSGEWKVDKLLYADKLFGLRRSWKEGTPFGGGMKKINELFYEIAESNKAKLILFQAEWLAKKYPNAEIHICFVDDRPEILRAILHTYTSGLLPENVHVKVVRMDYNACMEYYLKEENKKYLNVGTEEPAQDIPEAYFDYPLETDDRWIDVKEIYYDGAKYTYLGKLSEVANGKPGPKMLTFKEIKESNPSEEKSAEDEKPLRELRELRLEVFDPYNNTDLKFGDFNLQRLRPLRRGDRVVFHRLLNKESCLNGHRGCIQSVEDGKCVVKLDPISETKRDALKDVLLHELQEVIYEEPTGSKLSRFVGQFGKKKIKRVNESFRVTSHNLRQTRIE